MGVGSGVLPELPSGWRKLRAFVLARDDNLCQIGGNRCTVVATEVHHRIPRWRGGAVLDPTNCVSVCHNCHPRGQRDIPANRWQ